MKLHHSLILASLLTLTHVAHAQNVDYYDDYSSFTQDYEDLDDETRAVFGKFFQTTVYAGTGLFTGELGAANSAGVNIGVKFIYYFDPTWAAEIGGFWIQHASAYTPENTGAAGNLNLSTRLIPIVGSLRYAFDTQNMPRGLAQMNPYLSAGGALVFRQEAVSGTPNIPNYDAVVQTRYSEGAIFGSTNFGLHVGGGAEFDVYKNRVFAGLDLRYYMMFWSDASLRFGNLGRLGSYFSILGSVSYAY